MKGRILGLWAVFLWATHAPASQSLDLKNWQHVEFEGIRPTVYRYEPKTKELVARVESSSSILVQAFSTITKVKELSFEWRASGELPVAQLNSLRKKSGDDAVLRIGLLLHGKPPLFAFTAPAWLKKVSKILKHPSDTLLYLVAGLKEGGLRWKSPYSSTIEQISVALQPAADKSWNKARHRFETPVAVVGLWILADGDNSKVSFQSKLRALDLLTLPL